MRKATYLFLLVFSCCYNIAFGQCISPPPIPAACTGSEPILTDNETLNTGSSKWFYGSPQILNSVTMKGGTLIVCNDLTIDKFYIDSGAIYIRPGARLIIGSGIGAGLIFDGNCQIYNYGYCEIQRNVSFGNAHVSATRPNMIINALPGSVFRMANQYFVINSPYSWFVNNGTAEFWGIITDPLSSAGSVCMGLGSTIRMAVLINKIADTYIAPSGNACVNVFQFSQFSNRLTNTPRVHVCLGSGHTSASGCGGCPANDWGLARVFTGCVSCFALGVLPIQFSDFTGRNTGFGNQLNWAMSIAAEGGLFKILRSEDGKDFKAIDSLKSIDFNQTISYQITDKTPKQGDNYYMINYTHHQSGISINSSQIKLSNVNTTEFSVYPMPFTEKFFISYPTGAKFDKIILTDITGKNLAIRYNIRSESNLIEVILSAEIPAGIYLLHMRTDRQNLAKTIVKQ